MIPQRVLDEFPLGIINVHPSLLPQYRGPTPIEQAMLDGVEKTGVSIMHLTSGMDEGPLYKQKTLHVDKTKSKNELTQQLQRLGADMIQEVLPLIAAGELKPRQQSHPDRASYSQKITKSHGTIDWTKPADVLEREIRTYSGWPKSHTTIGDVEVVIVNAQAVHGDDTPTPGQIIASKKQLLVGTGSDWLEITTLQPIGKKEMPVAAFLAGYRSQIAR